VAAILKREKKLKPFLQVLEIFGNHAKSYYVAKIMHIILYYMLPLLHMDIYI